MSNVDKAFLRVPAIARGIPAEVASTASDVAGRVETWLAKNFAVNVNFKIANALETLNRLGQLFVPPLGAGGRLIAPGLE